MAKRSKKRKSPVPPLANPESPADWGRARESVDLPPPSDGDYLPIWIALVLATLTFLVYWPSLSSDFVYDAHIEVIDEGFITSLTNLPDVFTFKVLTMNLMLGDRPGQLLYLMLIAAICGQGPFGYHLCSNLLHAINVALLFIFLQRLIRIELPGLTGRALLKAHAVAAVVTLIFALHPINTETVANVSYSSDLLVTFFTLLALLAAMAFHPGNYLLAGAIGTLCAFASVICKESGLTTSLLLVAYWFLFRRNETKTPWLIFLGAAIFATVVFLAARLYFAPPNPSYLTYLGGSLAQVFWIQPRIWIFMMGKLALPDSLSADYLVEDVAHFSTPISLAILLVVLSLQGWLSWKSRLGALGVAFYWLGLATVSNFIPLYRPMADRFYYLPMAGVALQLAALFLMTLKLRAGFWLALTPWLILLLLLALSTVIREDVFASDFALWSDTVQVSPNSALAHSNLGRSLYQRGKVDESMHELQKALALHSDYADAHYNIGIILYHKKRLDEAIAHFRRALEIKPAMAQAHYNLGLALGDKGDADAEILEYQKALDFNPSYLEARNNLAISLFQKGRVNEAISELERALLQHPGDANIENNIVRMKASAQQSDKRPAKP